MEKRKQLLWRTLEALLAVAFISLIVGTAMIRERSISPEILAARASYMADEGHARRGPRFSELCSHLDDVYSYGIAEKLLHGRQYRQSTILTLLGAPDLFAGDMDRGNCSMAYFYDRFGEKDWVVYIDLRSGRLEQIGYNDVSVNDHSGWKKADEQNGR